MPLLDAFNTEQQSLALVFPGQGPFDSHMQRLDGGVAQPLASIRGCFVIAQVLCDIWNHAGMDNALVIACGIRLTMQVEIDTTVLVPLPNAREKSMHDSKTGNRKINPGNV